MAEHVVVPEVLYDDAHLLAIYKPCGMLSVPGGKSETTKTHHQEEASATLVGAAAGEGEGEDGEEEETQLVESSSWVSRSEQWTRAIAAAATSGRGGEDEEETRAVLRLLQQQKQVAPRKHKVFLSFLSRVLKVKDQARGELVWRAICKADEELHSPKLANLSSSSASASDLATLLLNGGHKVYHVHRLDMETSGVLLFAKTSESCAEMSRQFRDREVKKKYLARVAGRVDASLTSINVPIRADLFNRPMQIVDSTHGKQAETLILRIVSYTASTTLVELRPISGRTHQLRLHMAHVGHPMLGDSLYAPKDVQEMSPKGLCLHACEIQFVHPCDKSKEIVLQSSDCFFVDYCDDDAVGIEKTTPI